MVWSGTPFGIDLICKPIFGPAQKILTKGQIISECPLEILDFPKIPRKIWQISALESKKVVKS